MNEAMRGVTRSQSYLITLSEMVVTALRLIDERAGQLPSIASVAQSMNMSRTTAYYYFCSPESLLEAINSWTVDRLIDLLTGDELSAPMSIKFARFSIEQSTAVNLLVQELLSPGDTLAHEWTSLVAAMEQVLESAFPDAEPDVEVHVAWLLGGPLQGPRLLQCRCEVDIQAAEVIQRFDREAGRLSQPASRQYA